MSNIDKNYEDFLKSLQEDNTQNTQEGFPFSEDFDIENFIKTTETPQTEPLQTVPEKENNFTPIKVESNTPKTENNQPSLEGEEKGLTFETEDKNYSLKRLEEKLTDLQQRFDETNTAKEEESAFSAELNKEEEEGLQTQPERSDEEFFSNISSAIQTLKGSLDNIVSTRLRYEENLIRQDQTLITRLREKTTRLKAINLALNSEVKRSKNEKLEYLRKTAEQTKELLSLRMQLSHAEERTKQGDFKISNLEQQITLLTQEKNLLDDEIAKIRQEKLKFLQTSAEQTRNIMQLRHQLSAKEEALKQEEVKTNFLEQQLKTVEAAHLALKQENKNSEINNSEIQRTLKLQREEIDSLTSQLNQSRIELSNKAAEATSLRQQLLNAQFSPEQNKNEAAVFAVKQETVLAPLQLAQQEHERKIALLRAEQSAELQRLRTKALQEETELRGELQRAEAKFHQEETFVNTLKMQIQNLESSLKDLEQDKANYKNKSDSLTREIEAIKENNRAELADLRETLRRSQNSYDKQQDFYNTLETQYHNTQREKYYLSEELKKVIAQKDDALLQNERYLTEIEKLKNEQNDITDNLKKEIQELLSSKNKLTQELNNLKQEQKPKAETVQQTQNNLQENSAALALLKTQLSALLNSRENTDKALLEAREEKLKLLNKLEEQTKQLNAFQINYQNEIAALTQEKEKARIEAEERIKNLEDKLKSDKELLLSLTQQLDNLKSVSNNITDQELNTERLKNQKLTQELEKAQKIFNQDTILLEELKNQYATLQERNTILEAELSKITEENKQIETERQIYKDQVEELKKQLEDVRTELKQGQEFTKQLSAQVAKLKMVNTALNAALKQTQEQKIEALNQTAKQTQEILELKAQLQKAQSSLLEFEQGTVKIKAEYETKIKELEEELKRVSAMCVTQTKEINEIKTDNLRLKTIAEEKLLLQNRFNALQKDAASLSEELNTYKTKAKEDTLIKAKTAALAAQLARVNKVKEELKQQLNATQLELKAATERERKTSQELADMRKNLAQNEATILKLKEQILPLAQKAAENMNAPKAVQVQKPVLPRQAAPKPEQQKMPQISPDKKVDILEDTFDETQTTKRENKKEINTQELQYTENSPVQRDILADYEEDEKAEDAQSVTSLTVFEQSEDINPLEEVNLPEREMDLSAIFDEEQTPAQPAITSKEAGRKLIVENVKTTEIPATATHAKKESKIIKELQDDPSENTLTDHSIRRSIVSRRPYSRNPLTTFKKEEEYSDFLKKTKSMFYRIKWSLFKD